MNPFRSFARRAVAMSPLRALAAALVAVATLPASPARATITPDAQKIVDRYVEASGGRIAWERTRNGRSVGRIRAFGLEGRVETWRRAPDRRASEVALGPFQLKDWTTGEKAWRVDPSGKLLALDGKDLEQAVTSAWFEHERWLEPDQGGGSVVALPDTKDSLGTRTVLEIMPPNGKSRRYEFDAKTGLLARVVTKNDQMTVTTTLADYRKVDGWMVPFRSVQEVAGAAANTATVLIDTVQTAVNVPDERFVPPAGETSRVTWLKTPGAAKLPFDYRSRHVWVRASVNGGPLADFIYDTGASATVIDSAYAAKIGLKTTGQMQAQGAGSAGGASFATLEKLRVEGPGGDGIEMHDVKAAVLSVNPVLAPFFWRECAGIVGFDAIVQFVNEIDFDGRELRLYDPKTFKYSGKGAEVPMTLAGHAPVVHVKIDGKYEGPARVDVGSSSTLDLHTPFVAEHDLIAKHPAAITVTGGGFGGTFQSHFARMQTLEIGPYKVDGPLIGLSTIKTGALASEDYAGNIGNRLLERFKVTLDYERRKIWLEPGARFAERETFSRFGAQLARIDGTIKAAQVLPKSPAAEAGIREGDVIVSIDGLAAATLDPDQIDAKFEQGKPGTRIEVAVLRDGKPKKVKVALREIL